MMSRWWGGSIDISLRENKNWRGGGAAGTKKEEETKKRGCTRTVMCIPTVRAREIDLQIGH